MFLPLWFGAVEGVVPCYRLTRTFQIRLQNLPVITKKRKSCQVGSGLFHLTWEPPRLRRSSNTGIIQEGKFSLFLLMHFKVGDGARPAGGYPHDYLLKVCVLENDYTRLSLMFRMLHREKPRSSRHMRIVAERACTVRRRTPCSATWE